jgi:hypothetical protein
MPEHSISESTWQCPMLIRADLRSKLYISKLLLLLFFNFFSSRTLDHAAILHTHRGHATTSPHSVNTDADPVTQRLEGCPAPAGLARSPSLARRPGRDKAGSGSRTWNPSLLPLLPRIATQRDPRPPSRRAAPGSSRAQLPRRARAVRVVLQVAVQVGWTRTHPSPASDNRRYLI